MTYQELINNIRDLGFSDDAEVSEFGDLVTNAINRAITEMNTEFAHIKKKYEFEIDEDDEGFLYIDMTSIDSNFLGFVDHPVAFEQSGEEVYKVFSDYEIEADSTIVIDSTDLEGAFRIFYNAAHTPYTEDMAETQIPLPLKAHHLVPLLASYYVWLEDEPVKAAQYYNLYEQKKEAYISNAERPKMRILKGGI